jgi:chemotaxis response regulator CheB
MTQNKQIRVLLVDDHFVVRSGLGAVLNSTEDLILVGEAGNGEEAIRMCERLQPEVVLMSSFCLHCSFLPNSVRSNHCIKNCK